MVFKRSKFQIIQNQKNSLKDIENKIYELSIGTLVVPIVEEDVKIVY